MRQITQIEMLPSTSNITATPKNDITRALITDALPIASQAMHLHAREGIQDTSRNRVSASRKGAGVRSYVSLSMNDSEGRENERDTTSEKDSSGCNNARRWLASIGIGFGIVAGTVVAARSAFYKEPPGRDQRTGNLQDILDKGAELNAEVKQTQEKTLSKGKFQFTSTPGTSDATTSIRAVQASLLLNATRAFVSLIDQTEASASDASFFNTQSAPPTQFRLHDDERGRNKTISDNQRMSASGISKTVRIRKNLPNNRTHDSRIPGEILRIVSQDHLDSGIRNRLDTLLREAETSNDVRAAKNTPKANIYLLLEFIRLTSRFLAEKSAQIVGKKTDEITQIVAVIPQLNALFNEAANERYKQHNQVENTSSTRPFDAAADAFPPAAQLSAAKFQQSTTDALHALSQHHHAIPNLYIFLRKYVQKKISEYEQLTGLNTGLQPESKLKIAYRPPVQTHPHMYGTPAPAVIVRFFTLTEIATGHIPPVQDSSGRQCYIDSVEQEPVIDFLKKGNLPEELAQLLKDYNVPDLRSLHRGMTMMRCLQYLENPHRIPIFATAVENGLRGNNLGSRVFFDKVALRDAFYIPVNERTGVMFDVVSDRFFYISTYQCADRKPSLIVFPEAEKFRDFILSKMPLYERMKYENDTQAFSYAETTDSVTLPAAGNGSQAEQIQNCITPLQGYVLKSNMNEGHLSFSVGENLTALSDTLYADNIALQKSDFGIFEKIAGSISDNVNAAITFAASPLSAVNRGSMLEKIVLFTPWIIDNVTHTESDVFQAGMSELAGAFRNDAIGANVLANLAEEILQTQKRGADALYSSGGIDLLRNYFRQAKEMLEKRFPSRSNVNEKHEEGIDICPPRFLSGLQRTKRGGGPSKCFDKIQVRNYHIHPKLSVVSMARPTKNYERAIPLAAGGILSWGERAVWQAAMNIFAEEAAKGGFAVLISLDEALEKSFFSENMTETAMLNATLAKKNITYISDARFYFPDYFKMGENLLNDRIFLDKLVATVELIMGEKKKNPDRLVGIHCAAGDGRSGMVKTALYLKGKLTRRSNIGNKSEKVEFILCDADHRFYPQHIDTYPIVKRAIEKIREEHPSAVERPEEVALLNLFIERLSGNLH